MAMTEQISLEQAIQQMGSTPETEQAAEPSEDQALTEQAEPESQSDIDPDEQPLEADSDDVDDGESPEEHEEPDEEEGAPITTVEIDGEEIELTPENFREGYMRTADYTRKTQELAEHRKALASHTEQVAQRLGQIDQEYAAMETLLLGAKPEMPPVELLSTNPNEYELRKRAVQEWEGLNGNLGEWRQKVKAEQDQKVQEDRQKLIQAEGQKLVEVFKMKDAAEFQAKTGEIQNYLLKEGYPPESLQNMLDHKWYVTADKARKYDELMAKGGSKLKAKKPEVKSSSSSAPKKPVGRVTKAKQRFHKVSSDPKATRGESIEAALAAMRGA